MCYSQTIRIHIPKPEKERPIRTLLPSLPSGISTEQHLIAIHKRHVVQEKMPNTAEYLQ